MDSGLGGCRPTPGVAVPARRPAWGWRSPCTRSAVKEADKSMGLDHNRAKKNHSQLTQRMPGSFSGPWAIPETARWQGATGRKATLRTPHALSSAPAPCHGAGASKHPFSKRCCLPESEALSRLDSGLWTLVHAPAISGGMGLPVRASAHLAVCFEHPVHLFRASKRGVGGFSLSKEHGNMTAVSLALACAPSFGAALSTRRAQA